MRRSERWIVGALFFVALLAFFFPIASLQLPIVGTIEASGYDFTSKTKLFEDRLGNLNNQAPARSTEAPFSSATPSTATAPLPFSVRTIAVFPFEVLGSFALSAISLLLCIIGASRMLAKVSSSIAGVLGIGSILHIVIADSDLHSWFQTEMQATVNTAGDNPFAAFAQSISTLIANSVHFRPGLGLYMLAISVSIGALILFSGLVSGSNDERGSQQGKMQWQSDFKTRRIIFVIAMVPIVGVAIFVLLHQAGTPNINQVEADTKTQLQRQLNQDYAEKHGTVQNVSLMQTTAPKYEGEATISAYNQTFAIPLAVTSDGKSTLVTADTQKLSSGFETALQRDLAVLNGKNSDYIINSDIFEMMPVSLKSAKADFTARLETVSPIESDDRYFFGSGCKAHECAMNEAAWVIDKITGNGTAVIMKEEPANVSMPAYRGFHVYGTIGGEFPRPLLEWAEQNGMTQMNVSFDTPASQAPQK